MRALDRLKASVSMKPSRKVVLLPDGTEFEFWMTPLTLAERSRAQKQSRPDDAADFTLHILAAKAKDENGAPMFHQGDLPELRNSLPATVVESLIALLVENQEDEDDEELDMKSFEGAAAEGQPADGGTRRSRKASQDAK
jgi:hypothetical protein